MHVYVLIPTNTHYNILQMENEGGTCIMFTPSQYRSMYYSRMQNSLIQDSDQLDAVNSKYNQCCFSTAIHFRFCSSFSTTELEFSFSLVLV